DRTLDPNFLPDTRPRSARPRRSERTSPSSAECRPAPTARARAVAVSDTPTPQARAPSRSSWAWSDRSTRRCGGAPLVRQSTRRWFRATRSQQDLLSASWAAERSDSEFFGIPLEAELSGRRHVPDERRGGDDGGTRQIAFAADPH